MALPSTTCDVFAKLSKKVAMDATLVHFLQYSFITEKREQLVAALDQLLPDGHCHWLLNLCSIYAL